MQGRKEKGVSYFLPFTFKVLQRNYHPSSSEDRTEFIGFASQLAQFSCFFQFYTWNTIDEHQYRLKRSQKDRGELLKYIIYKKQVVSFTNSVQDRNSSMASKSV